MDKIGELKRKLALERFSSGTRCLSSDAFESGFDAAMELQLTVLFTDWHIKLKLLHKGIFIAPWDNYAEYTTKELYDYWIKNIYQPEK